MANELERLFVFGEELSDIPEDLMQELVSLEAGKIQGNWKGTRQYEVIEGLSKTKPKSSIECPPKLELKPIPENLKYAFLLLLDNLPVVISNALTGEKEEKLLRVLREHKEAFGWTIHDIKGISPSICTHIIHRKEEHKPKVQP